MPMVSIWNLWEAVFERDTDVFMQTQLFLIPHQWLKYLLMNADAKWIYHND